MRRLTVFICASALVVASMACASSQSSGTDSSGRATSLAQTAAALLTATAAASVTAATPTSSPSTTPPAPAAPAATATPTETPVPPASPTPTLAPASPTPCATNDSDFVADVNVPDGTHFAAGAAFVKTWRLRNSGACPWTTAYQFRLIDGDAMGSAPVNLLAEVPPGGEAEISVSFVAPSSAGTYRSQWQLFTPDSLPFGTKPFVLIKVP